MVPTAVPETVALRVELRGAVPLGGVVVRVTPSVGAEILTEFKHASVRVCVPELTVTEAVFTPAVEYAFIIDFVIPERLSVPIHE